MRNWPGRVLTKGTTIDEQCNECEGADDQSEYADNDVKDSDAAFRTVHISVVASFDDDADAHAQMNDGKDQNQCREYDPEDYVVSRHTTSTKPVCLPSRVSII